MANRALVLGGGGVTGIAWELGLIAGLFELGVDLRTADLVVGTSAGSTVGAQILSGTPIEELYQAQAAGPGREIRPPAGANVGYLLRLAVMMIRSRAARGDAAIRQFGARAGEYAKKVRTVHPEERLAVIASRLPGTQWPANRLLITAVNADDGEFRVFDRNSGVSLINAVAASCAVPGVWPPVRIADHDYIDGGVRSPANVDLAAGSERLVVLAPILRSGLPGTAVVEQINALGAGVRTALISPDRPAREAIGRSPLDPRSRPAAARAGREQASRVAEEIAAVWRS